ncbi:MAG: hypothetical protein GY727_04180 [Gammaproteobacteria bacterium]|nr:hypothetical protein [Gammaproteobacteria bacterium]MCP4091552.1 hypothetical protein [Gammaproteobacteria bacterium]MCP4929388.1 hypothetical protein [Gammaproteobacteria bacterium]
MGQFLQQLMQQKAEEKRVESGLLGASKMFAGSGLKLSPEQAGRAQSRVEGLLEGGMGFDQAAQGVMQQADINPELHSQLQNEAVLKRETAIATENRAIASEHRARQDQMMQIQDHAQQQQEYNEGLGQTNREAQAQLQSAARDLALVKDFGTMLGQVGTETLRTQDRGIMAAQRFQMLDMIRRTTEAGALQQAEIELFNEIIPEHDEWIKFSEGERQGKLQQFEYWMQSKAQDKALALGLDFSAIPDLSRSYQEITRPSTQGFTPGRRQ